MDFQDMGNSCHGPQRPPGGLVQDSCSGIPLAVSARWAGPNLTHLDDR